METNREKKSILLNVYMVVLAIMVIMIHNQSLVIVESKMVYSGINRFFMQVLSKGILNTSVTGFFVISGYLLFRKFSIDRYTTMLRKKIKTLLIPYFLWNFVGLLYAYLVTHISIFHRFSSMNVVNFDWKTIIEALLFHKYNIVGWYMVSLMALLILSPVIDLCISGKKRTILFLLLFIFYYIFWGRHMLIRDFGTLSFVLGGILGKNKPDWAYECNPFRFNNWITGILLIVVAIVRAGIESIMNGNMIVAMGNHLLRILFLLLLWNLVVGIWKIKTDSDYNYSFPIYMMHWYFLSVFQKLFIKIIPANNVTVWIIYLGSTICTAILVILFAKLWKMVFPKAYCWFMGGR